MSEKGKIKKKEKEDEKTKRLRAEIEDLLTDTSSKVRADLEKAILSVHIKRFARDF